MTAEQFVFWLRGYLAAGGNNPAIMTQGDWKAVMEMLKVVTSPQADADVRLLARKRLLKERDDFLRKWNEQRGAGVLPQPMPMDPGVHDALEKHRKLTQPPSFIRL